jgi:hypothetical protein
MVTSLTEYITVDKQVLEEILRELGEIKKLASTVVTVVEEGVSCSDEFVSEQT